MSTSLAVPSLPVGRPGKAVSKKSKREAAAGEIADAINPRTWQKALGLISAGNKVDKALRDCGISHVQLEGALRGSHLMREGYEQAKLTAVRSKWDSETIDEILIQIAMGRTVMDALKGAMLDEPTTSDVSSFMQLVLKDAVVKEAYEDARRVQAEMMADDIMLISDDGRNDTYTDEEGRRRVDYDVVNRSKMRIDSRKWLMSKLHWQRFGDRIQQDQNINLTVDHAERLANARKRIEARNAGQPATE